MPRRREVLAVVMASAVAGCGGLTDPGGSDPDDPEDDDDPAGTDEPAGTDSPAGGDPGGDADADTDDTEPTSTDQPGVSIAADYDSYAVDMEILVDQEGSATMVHDADTQWDLANDRTYRRYELREEGDEVGEGLVTEYYVIGGTAYRVQLGSCVSASAAQVNPQQISSIAVPTEAELQQAQSLEYVGTETIDGTQAEVYTYDLAESMNIIGGEMTVYVGVQSGYLLLLEGSYEVGQHESPTVVTFTVRNHSFGENFDIEVPDSCEE